MPPEEEKLAKWTTCRLTGERLLAPVCADELGNLYNKSAVVTGLVGKSLPPSTAHITSLRHLIDVKLERNPNKVQPQSMLVDMCIVLWTRLYLLQSAP